MAPPRPPRRRPPSGTTVPLWAVLLVITGGFLAVWAWLPAETLRAANQRVRAHFRSEPSVILVLLDTVRADHTSLCGYERPTTPRLAALAGARGAHHTCTAVSPATWTIPAVASHLTGQTVPEHRMDTVRDWADDGSELRPSVRALPSAAKTLAERYIDRGYQTAIISENPLVNNASGLLQGYSESSVVPRYPGARGQFVLDAVRALVRQRLDPVRPLFLTVVLAASHEPLSAVPGGLGWVPRTSALNCFGRPAGACKDLLLGRLRRDEAADTLGSIRDLYDYGLSRTDAHLGAVLDELEDWGWRSGPSQLVVVGTGGVLLGEEGRYGAGSSVAEALARVPVVEVRSDGAEASFAESGPVSALDVRRTLWGDATLPPAEVTTYGNRTAPPRRGDPDFAPGIRAAATWRGTEKVIWRDGAWFRTDLASDPAGTDESPLDARPDGPVPEVDRWLDAVGRGPADEPAPLSASPSPG